jgi:demethylmenaquinone methyltransferase/2-methoxy-6-polyprenyl-1,4-benzoquinol methylase
MIRHDAVIEKILDNAGVKSGMDVLDVACGTGVLIPDYLSRGVASVTGVDISSEMVRIAREKFTQENVQLICGDVEEHALDKAFDCIMVYNAFPHFPEPEKLIEKLSTLLKAGGTLTVAHGMSKAEIDRRHKGAAERVSVGLMEHDVLAELFARYLTVTVKISDDTMYQVTGRKE